MTDTQADKTLHYNRKPLRKAEFIKPPNLLKAKVGSGGLSDDIIDKAQKLLENNAVDFLPLAEMYLSSLMQAIEYSAKTVDKENDTEHLITRMIYPAMQLKANGGMFHYPLITQIADRLIHFLEVVAYADEDVIDIVQAYHTTMRAVILGKVTGMAGRYGDELLDALESACTRYFERHPENARDTEMQDLNQNY